MKILLGSLTYPLPNGVTSSIDNSISGFKKTGHEMLVVAPDYKTGSVRPEHKVVSASRIAEIITNPLGNKERFFGLKAAAEIQGIIREFRPDAFWLHTVTWAPNLFETIMTTRQAPKVVTYHTMLDVYGKLYAGSIGEQHMTRRSVEVCNSVDRVIAPSDFMAEKLKEFGVETSIDVIPSGIEPIGKGFGKEELHKRYKIPDNHHILLYVGRMVREKNISSLLKMMSDLLNSRKDVTLLLVGAGSIDGFSREATELGVDKNVVFAGQVANAEARKHYSGSDLFVFASQTETQGLVLGEAMSAGLPIVALDSPIREQFYPESIARIAHTESELAVSVLDVLSDPDVATRMQVKGREFFDKAFALEKMVSAQVGVFEELVGSRGLEPLTLSV